MYGINKDDEINNQIKTIQRNILHTKTKRKAYNMASPHTESITTQLGQGQNIELQYIKNKAIFNVRFFSFNTKWIKYERFSLQNAVYT